MRLWTVERGFESSLPSQKCLADYLEKRMVESIILSDDRVAYKERNNS